MHHLLILVPFLALILFLIAPWEIALPVYLFLAAGALVGYYKALRALREPPIMGEKTIVGQQAKVVRVEKGEIDVEYDGEIWKAASSQRLEPGQQVIIKGVHGLVLQVEPPAPSSGP